MKVIPSFVILVATCACSTPPQETAPAPKPEPVATAPAPDAAASRADALLADIAKREAEYKKAEADVAARERLKPMPTMEAASPSQAPSSSIPAAASASATPAATNAPAQAQPAGDGRDESWWKSRMRDAEVAFNDETIRLVAAEKAADEQRLQISYDKALAEVNARKAAVANARAAVERIREDARRANVPPGWLRWP